MLELVIAGALSVAAPPGLSAMDRYTAELNIYEASRNACARIDEDTKAINKSAEALRSVSIYTYARGLAAADLADRAPEGSAEKFALKASFLELKGIADRTSKEAEILSNRVLDNNLAMAVLCSKPTRPEVSPPTNR